MTPNIFIAVVLVIIYSILCWYFLGRGKNRSPDLQSIPEDAILIAYASQSGQAETLANQYATAIQPSRSVVLIPLNQVDKQLIDKTSLALFIASTYGEGEAPDNGLRFQQTVLGNNNQNQSLSHLTFAVLALGDSEYRFFCQFGVSISESLQALGATPLFDTVQVDKLNPEHLQIWQQQLINHKLLTSEIQSPRLTEKPFIKGKLIEQQCLNLGSPGAPAYLVRIQSPKDCTWQAGDIVEVQPQNNAALPIREYSIASIPADGSIDLLVRQVCKDDGSMGLGSSWLTKLVNLNETVNFRIRSNPNFHVPDNSTPMILIGNGTGMAGLRSLLKQRATENTKQNCLFFGERTHAFDFHFADEINQWQKARLLQQTFLVFSRDQQQKRYVQSLILEEASFIRKWIENGAAIYVCGSLEGMASGVDEALQSVLGHETVSELKINGRYRRDVY